MATGMRKIDGLRDSSDGIDEAKLNEIKAALDKATAVVDQIENEGTD